MVRLSFHVAMFLSSTRKTPTVYPSIPHTLPLPTGIKVVSGATAKEVTKEADGTLSVHLENGEVR